MAMVRHRIQSPARLPPVHRKWPAGEIVVGTVCPATLKGRRSWGLSPATGIIGRNFRISPWGNLGLSCGSPVRSRSLIQPVWRGNGSDSV